MIEELLGKYAQEPSIVITFLILVMVAIACFTLYKVIETKYAGSSESIEETNGLADVIRAIDEAELTMTQKGELIANAIQKWGVLEEEES